MSATPHHETPSGAGHDGAASGPRAAVVAGAEGGAQSDSAPPLYQAGDIIAQKYRLTRLLGRGGMGSVWLARNIKLDVDVAIKLIRHELGTAEASARLLQEARAAARIGHRSIVRIFDFGETELDDPFIVMEVLTGDSLRDLLERKGRLPAANAVRTLLPIASALVEAHASGVVHRDLKPENVMLVPDKSGAVVPKLVDFGIAKFHRAEEPAAEDASRLAFVVGTPDYMAPEQAGGRDEVTEAADVWALSVILYEAITGHVPFSGPNYAALIFAIMTADPAPAYEQMAGDAELWEILRRGLAKSAADRPSMREIGMELARWAILRGIESDVAGTSLAAHWIDEPAHSPFSALPPPVMERPSLPEEIEIPRPGAVPSGLRVPSQLTPTEAPPRSEEPRSRSPLAIAMIAVALGVTAIVAGRWRSPQQAAPTAPAVPAPSVIESAAPATLSASASAIVSASTPAPPAEAPSADPSAAASAKEPPAPSGKLGPRKPPRKSNLPIAKQPNF